jgi:hypothetical protein
LVLASPPPHSAPWFGHSVQKRHTAPNVWMAVLQTSNVGDGLLARTAAAHGPTQFAHGWAVVTLQLVEVRKTNSRT